LQLGVFRVQFPFSIVFLGSSLGKIWGECQISGYWDFSFVISFVRLGVLRFVWVVVCALFFFVATFVCFCVGGLKWEERMVDVVHNVLGGVVIGKT